MPADTPTILATSGGIVPGTRTHWSVGPLTELAVDLSGVEGRAPRVCYVGTASGDSPNGIRDFYDLADEAGFTGSHLQLFSMPNVPDIQELLLDQDVIWVFGGSVAGLLAMWELHGVDAVMREAWQAGVVLTGVSAGSICWHVGGTTDSFGPDLRAIDNGLALVPFSNGVHYDSEAQRRPLYHRLVADETLPAGYATDDCVGVLYRGTDYVVSYAETDRAGAYFVEQGADGAAIETQLEVERLR